MSVDFRAFEEWPITRQADNLKNQSEAKANMCFLHYGWENVCKHVKFAFQNRLGQPYSWEEIYRFCFLFLCIWRQFPSTSPHRRGGGLYLEERFNGGFFPLRVWGTYNRRGLYMGGGGGLFSEFYGIWKGRDFTSWCISKCREIFHFSL